MEKMGTSINIFCNIYFAIYIARNDIEKEKNALFHTGFSPFLYKLCYWKTEFHQVNNTINLE